MTNRSTACVVVAAWVLASCAGSDPATEPVAAPTPSATTEVPTTDVPTTPATAPPEATAPVPTTTAAPAEQARERSITVGGMGSHYGPPDRAVVEVGVTSTASTVDAATRQAAAAGSALAAELQAAGVPDASIQTSQFNIAPRYSPPDYELVTGYDTTIGYRVIVPDVEALGSVLARAVTAGGDSVRAWSVRFEGDPAAHMDQARAAAWDDVRARAQATAGEIGEPLGEVLDVHEKVLVTSPYGMSQGGEGDSATFDIPVSPGIVGVVVLLTVTFAIGG